MSAVPRESTPYITAATVVAVMTLVSGCGTELTAPSPTPALYTLSGTVSDIATVKPISGASVSVPDQRTTTDGSGNYSLRLTAGTHDVTFSAAGYSSAVATIVITGDTLYRRTLAIETPNPPTTANITGTWNGVGSYPNAPFQLFLEQTGNNVVGYYKDQLDNGRVVGAFLQSGPFTLVVDFGDGSLRLECNPITSPRQVEGVQRTSALGSRPYPFTMTR